MGKFIDWLRRIFMKEKQLSREEEINDTLQEAVLIRETLGRCPTCKALSKLKIYKGKCGHPIFFFECGTFIHVDGAPPGWENWPIPTGLSVSKKDLN